MSLRYMDGKIASVVPLGGDITVASEPGKGSVFTVRLRAAFQSRLRRRKSNKKTGSRPPRRRDMSRAQTGGVATPYTDLTPVPSFFVANFIRRQR